ncbi:MAG: sigma 54-interacting transcriptional regulator [bacterium]
MSNLNYTLLQIYRLLLECRDLCAPLPAILDLVIQGTNAERGQIELYDEKGERRFLKARKAGRDIEDRRECKISSKILSWVKETGEIVLSANARKDARFWDSGTVLGQNVLSVVCAPLHDQRGTFGVVYIDNCNREALFNHETQDLLHELAGRLAGHLRKRIEQYDERKHISRELQDLRGREMGYLALVGNSAAIQEVLERVELSRDSDDNVLILGDSGTGKELVARLLHHQSERGEKKFVAFDCSAVPEDILISELFGHEKGSFTGALQRQRGLVEEAEGGTLFLDEIGNLSMRVQAMLLRFLDHKQYRRLGAGEETPANVRLTFATNQDLTALVQKGVFREDLYFRLKKGVVLQVPPLRKRKEDIPLIADFLLNKFNQAHKTNVCLSAEVRQVLMSYSYPGNVRELEALLCEAAHLALRAKQETIRLLHLPKALWTGCEAQAAGAAPAKLELSPDGFYNRYLPPEFKDRLFIWGHPCRMEDATQASPADHQLHEQLLISIKPVPGMPLKLATRAVAHAFERNVLIALLQQTGGRQHEAIKLAGINKSAFINKIKRHGICIKRNQFG